MSIVPENMKLNSRIQHRLSVIFHNISFFLKSKNLILEPSSNMVYVLIVPFIGVVECRDIVVELLKFLTVYIIYLHNMLIHLSNRQKPNNDFSLLIAIYFITSKTRMKVYLQNDWQFWLGNNAAVLVHQLSKNCNNIIH